VLEILPFLAGVAAFTSVVLLIVIGKFGDLKRGTLTIFLVWFLVAGYCQFFGGSPVAGAVGLALQTLLAIGLLTYWKLNR